jgi:hypothetical protein
MMNEQIRELAKQADLDWHKHWNDDESNRLEKFAELIVEQCAGIIESQDVDPSFKLRMSWAVKQYFGVEQ